MSMHKLSPQTQEWDHRRTQAGDLYRRGQFGEYLQLSEQNLTLARNLQDRLREGSALNDIGLAHINCWQPQQALECFEQALSIAQELGNDRGRATALSNIGSAQSH